MKISEVLRKAADIIDEQGHYQFNGKEWSEEARPKCALTAIRDVQRNYDEGQDAFRFLQRSLFIEGVIPRDTANAVYEWNDNAAEGLVQAKLRELADQYESQSIEVW